MAGLQGGHGRLHLPDTRDDARAADSNDSPDGDLVQARLARSAMRTDRRLLRLAKKAPTGDGGEAARNPGLRRRIVRPLAAAVVAIV